MDEPFNPLDVPGEPAGDLTDLPTSEPLQAPVPPEERVAQAQAPPPEIAAQNGAGRAGALGGPQPAAKAAPAPAPAFGNAGYYLGPIQSDLEQLHAEAISTRRATQLLALSIAAVAALILVYAVRAARAGTGPAK